VDGESVVSWKTRLRRIWRAKRVYTRAGQAYSSICARSAGPTVWSAWSASCSSAGSMPATENSARRYQLATKVRQGEQVEVYKCRRSKCMSVEGRSVPQVTCSPLHIVPRRSAASTNPSNRPVCASITGAEVMQCIASSFPSPHTRPLPVSLSPTACLVLRRYHRGIPAWRSREFVQDRESRHVEGAPRASAGNG
jgi:hypothetical protein